ncbi:TetR/AcrR family transcriptional regulator [Cupriavidus metallidurans]|uniref:TetR/AcrR family transcriptional regulator n=1 Tax=Cupriavidus metallidurans TaxID=119219 RepID=UPI00056035B8|nr:TetR/AcrR family transcriptional regulator [Cupriavidus metallidurans]
MSKAPRGTRADGEATRARILEAAGELFAAAGYATTTSKAIAARAGVDQASINYHFGSRSRLYQAVVAEGHRYFVSVDDLRALAESKLSSSQKLWMLLDLLVQGATSGCRGWHLKVLAQELLAPSPHRQTILQDVALPKLSFIKAIISEIAAIPEDDPALMRCILSVLAPSAMLLLNSVGAPGPLATVLTMPREALTRHLHIYALGGLEAIRRERALSHDALGPR